ncbi:MAG TPA: hypothetical protein VIM58_05190 [Candidatus Methylacidiphilales bacterium]
MRAPFFLLLAPCLVLLGCTTATSLNTTDTDVPAKNGLVNGTYYYLPQGTVVVEGRVEPADREAKDGLPPVRKGDFTVTISVALEPDRRARLFFKPDENFFLDSDTRLVVNGKALLDTVTTSPSNQGVPTALAIAQMAPTLLDFGPAPDGAAPFVYRFDPFDGAQAAAVRRALDRNFGLRLAVSPSLAYDGDPKGGPGGSSAGSAAIAEKYPGILFRPVVPLTLTFRTGKAAAGEQEVLCCVPDKRKVLAFDLRRGVLIDKVTELQFRDGVLVSSHIDKPGFVTSLITIPLQMIHTVFTGGV